MIEQKQQQGSGLFAFIQVTAEVQSLFSNADWISSAKQRNLEIRTHTEQTHQSLPHLF